MEIVASQGCGYLHRVLLSFQLPGYEFQSILVDVMPQISVLFGAVIARFGERVAFVQVQLVAGAVEGHHFVQCGRIRATFTRYIWPTSNRRQIIKHRQLARSSAMEVEAIFGCVSKYLITW